MRDVQLHGSAEERCDGWVELAAGEELESRAEGRVVDEDADELLHDRLWVFHEFGEPAVHLGEGRQRELGADCCPGLIVDGLRDQSSGDSSVSLMLSRRHCAESGSRRSVAVRRAEWVPERT